MSDDDLIRRVDVLRAFNRPSADGRKVNEIIAAIPAAPPAVGDCAAERDALAAQLAEAEARARSSALDALAAYGQAAEAYEAQLAAEAKLATARETNKRFHRRMQILEGWWQGKVDRVKYERSMYFWLLCRKKDTPPNLQAIEEAAYQRGYQDGTDHRFTIPMRRAKAIRALAKGGA